MIHLYLKGCDNIFNNQYIRYGFIQGDGGLGRLKSKEHLGLEVNIGKNDYDILPLFCINPREYADRKIYYTGENQNLKNLGFSSEKLPNRVLPTSYNQWNNDKKLSFLRGLWSANGSVIRVKNKTKNGDIKISCRISFKGTCKKLIEQLKVELKTLGLNPYYTTNKPKKVKFSNGEYLCKESYDLNLGRIKEIEWFMKNIGFVQNYKIEKYYSILNNKTKGENNYEK